MSSFRRRLMMAQGGGKRTPDTAENGVYIQDIDGFLYTVDEWNLPNEQANGVALINNLHPNNGFVMAKKSYEEPWGDRDYINNITTTTDENKAKSDYKGINNTNQIYSQYVNSSAAKSCKNYVFPNGKKGYLGGLGEILMITQNFESIQSCLKKIDGNSLTYGSYWSSTQYSESKAWSSNYSGVVAKQYKSNYYYKFYPLCKLF